MHQDPEHEDYDDDDYKYYPEYNDYGYPYSSKNFKFDWSIWEEWLCDAIKEIVNDEDNVWLFGNTNYVDSTKYNKKTKMSNEKTEKYFKFLGKNLDNDEIWKAEYFINKHFNQEYNNHINQYAAHFLKQPSYYRGMFNILN